MKNLLVKLKDKAVLVSIDEILYCCSSDNYATLFLRESKPILLSKSLSWLQNELGNEFLRISQSNLVNINHVLEIYPKQKEILMTNGQKLKFTQKYTAICNYLCEFD